MTKELADIHKVHPANKDPYYEVPPEIWEPIAKRLSGRKMKLVLDFTKQAKEDQKEIAENEIIKDIEGSQETILTLYYPNGEHACTFPEVRNPAAGRAAAKRFMKYCNCKFIDHTK